MEEYFRILEIEPTRDVRRVKEARRTLAMVWHPDRLAHSPEMQAQATAKIKAINEAYERIMAHLSSGAEVPPTRTAAPSRPGSDSRSSRPGGGRAGTLTPERILQEYARLDAQYVQDGYAEWRWHKWLADQVQSVYGADREIFDLASSLASNALAHRGKTGKREREAIYLRQVVRLYFIRFQKTDFMTSSGGHGRLDFRHGKPVSFQGSEGTITLRDLIDAELARERSLGCSGTFWLVVVVVTVILLFALAAVV